MSSKSIDVFITILLIIFRNQFEPAQYFDNLNDIC